MKRLLLASVLFLISTVTYAATPSVYRSSNTATADTAQSLCTRGASRHAEIHTVCVNTGAAGTLTLFNAFSTGVNPIAAIDTAAKGCQIFDVVTSSGLTYTNSATANVTIAFDCY